MKKWKILILASVLALGLSACAENEVQKDSNIQNTVIAESVGSAETGGAETNSQDEENSAGLADTSNAEADEPGDDNTGAVDKEDEGNAESDNQEAEIMDEAAKEAELKAKKYGLLTEATILSTGNNYRLKNVLNKVKNGEHINVATLGGSITEGGNAKPMTKGYAYNFADAFKSTYGENITFVNAGLSGTPSALGVMRYEKDVLTPLGCAPDLLFIEFAVNDWNEATKCRAYESLIYQALTDNPDCAVVLIFAVTNKQWNLQKELAPYGYYYQLPMVSMSNAFSYLENLDSEYFSDEFHPTNAGHVVMCDCVMALLAKIDGQEMDEPFELPEEAKTGRDFMHMELVVEGSEKVKINRGAFTETDKEIQNCIFTNSGSFPDNYMHVDGEGSLAMEMECKEILVDFKTSSKTEFGEAEILVDGNVIMKVNGYQAGGWNNSNVVLVLDEQESAKHTLEIRMVSGQENKKFTVLGVAVN